MSRGLRLRHSSLRIKLVAPTVSRCKDTYVSLGNPHPVNDIFDTSSSPRSLQNHLEFSRPNSHSFPTTSHRRFTHPPCQFYSLWKDGILQPAVLASKRRAKEGKSSLQKTKDKNKNSKTPRKKLAQLSCS